MDWTTSCLDLQQNCCVYWIYCQTFKYLTKFDQASQVRNYGYFNFGFYFIMSKRHYEIKSKAGKTSKGGSDLSSFRKLDFEIPKNPTLIKLKQIVVNPENFEKEFTKDVIDTIIK